VWRASFEGASLTAVVKDDLKKEAISKEGFATLKARIIEGVPEGKRRENALRHIDKGRAADLGAYQKALAAQLKSLACSGHEDAAYIVRGLNRQVVSGVRGAGTRIYEVGPLLPGLVEAILKPDCLVSAALTEADKAALKKIAKEASGAH
jgi:hypothetical protein